MAASKPPKSILKKTTGSFQAPSKEERDRETALYHANLIQQRKDIELEILLSTERLIDFPLSSSSTASNPALTDVNLFKTLVHPFQPSDYDCLIQERNINEHCGYALCPKARYKDGTSATFRLVGMSGKAKDFRVVPKEELEKWCSEDCAKRAMFVKVQLSERSAMERVSSTRQVELLDEEKMEGQKRDAQLAKDLKRLSLSRGGQSQQGAADLALERGDSGAAAADGLVGVFIKENEVMSMAEAPSLDAEGLGGRFSDLHLGLEGHIPRFQNERR